ncbi:MAG: J domain-containing protein [Epsilonproteobacteria bacterium]|nr:J domain-containing protein [Campylobacterota bacterium]
MEIKEALEILELPPFITKDDIKVQYKKLVKRYHPDIAKDSSKIVLVNEAYKTLMSYIENYKYSFDDEEINRQLPTISHNKKFKL